MAFDYPAYMTDTHSTWITALAAKMTTASPYSGLTGYDPATDITAMNSAVTAFQAIITAMDEHVDFDTLHTAAAAQVDAIISPSTYITARVSEHSADLDNETLSKVLPRFEAGMRDVGGIMTSAFAIGRAIIERDAMDKVAKFDADMRFQADNKRADLTQAAVGEMIRLKLQKVEFGRTIAAMILDVKRLAISAQNDYKTETKAIASDNAKWPFEIYKYGANMLASISGATTSSVPMDGSKSARILGTALSGAAAGAMVGASIGSDNGAGYGALIGAGLSSMMGG